MKNNLIYHGIALIVCSCFLPQHHTQAFGVVLGVTGDSNEGANATNTIYEINVNDGSLTSVGQTFDNGSVVPNTLAFDESNNIYYYGDNDGTNLYSFNRNTNTNTSIADLTSIPGTGSMPSGTRLSGSGDFNNGRFYFVPEIFNAEPNTEDDIHWIEFDTSGTSITDSGIIEVTLPDGLISLGDFGDMAIDPQTGILYGASRAIADNEVNGIWTVDIDSAAPTLTELNTSTNDETPQIAFDASGSLYGNIFDTRQIVEIDKVTGEIIPGTTVDISGGADFFDMATVSIPFEFSPSLGLLLSGLLFIGSSVIANTRKSRRQRSGLTRRRIINNKN